MVVTTVLFLAIVGLLYYGHHTKKSKQQKPCCEHHGAERLEAFIPLPLEPDTLDDIIVIAGPDGQELEFQVVDLIEVNGKVYALLLSTEEEADDSEDVLVLRVEEDVLEAITDDDEFAAVVEYLTALVNQEENA